MRLLVVDDEKDVQLLFQQKFRKELKSGEMQILYTFDGPTALKLLESLENRAAYLILSDINMPVMNGLELLRQIKESYPDLKVIMITAYGDEHNYNMAKKFGADDYFTKPLEFNLLKDKLIDLTDRGS
jgi:two-component system, chemotaxis family, chemotaxis protein CheY